MISSAIFPMMALVIGLILDSVSDVIKFIRIPSTILIFIFTLIASIVLHIFLPASIMNEIDENYTWKTFEPGIIVGILLPPMIFESAFKINSYVFFGRIKLLITLTAIVYFLTLFIYAFFMYFILHITSEWGIFTVCLMSSILAATDPVAVVAILEDIGAPQRLQILIEGESLLNDAIAIFVYQIFSNFAMIELNLPIAALSWKNISFMLLNCLIISPIIGISCAHLIIRVNQIFIKDNKRIQMFLVLVVYVVWIIMEQFRGSPAIAIVVCGLQLNYFREDIQPATVQMTLEMWSAFSYWANCVIFTFGGYTIGILLFNNPLDMGTFYFILSGILLYPMTFFSRMASLAIFKLFWKGIIKSHFIYDSDYVLLSYGGLKGALALLLAHHFNEDTTKKGMLTNKIAEEVVIYCSSAVFMCLILQGTTFFYIARKEGVNHRSRYIQDFERNMEHHLNRKLKEGIGRMRRNAELFLSEANWMVVNEQIEANVFKGFATATGFHSRVQTSEEHSALSGSTIEEPVAKDESHDVRAGYYSVLLARVYDVWSKGALSGATAHIAVALLEHGIDEGKLDLEDFLEQFKAVEMDIAQSICFSMSTKLKTWLNNNTWIFELFCKPNEPFLESSYNEFATVLIPERSKEWWSLFSTILAIFHSILLSVVLFYPIKPNVIYWVLMSSFLAATIFLIEEFASIHETKKLENRDIDSIYSNDLTIRLCRSFIIIIIILCIFISLIIILTTQPHGSCLDSTGHWKNLEVCRIARIVLITMTVILCTIKILRHTVPSILTIQEALSVKNLLHVRIQLSVLYFFQHLLSQLPLTFHLFPDVAFKNAIIEQKNLQKIIEALIRLKMKNTEVLDIIPAIKTRQAIRMASHSLQNTINELKAQGFIHEESMGKWRRSIERLRNDGERLIISPSANLRQILENVHWIRNLNRFDRDDVITKLYDYIEAKPADIQLANQTIKRGVKSMLFLKKGICRATEMWCDRKKVLHTADRYHHQGQFIGEHNLLSDQTQPVRLIKQPEVIYQTTTDCHFVAIDENIIKWLRETYKDIMKTISKVEQTRKIVQELKQQRRLYPLMIMENFGRVFKKYGSVIKKQTVVEVDTNRTLILGWRLLVVSLRPPTAYDDNYNVVGPATVTMKPADVDEGLFLIVETDQVNQASSEELESNLSLTLEEDSKRKVKMSTKKQLPETIETAVAKISKELADVSAIEPTQAASLLTSQTQYSPSQQLSMKTENGIPETPVENLQKLEIEVNKAGKAEKTQHSKSSMETVDELALELSALEHTENVSKAENVAVENIAATNKIPVSSANPTIFSDLAEGEKAIGVSNMQSITSKSISLKDSNIKLQ